MQRTLKLVRVQLCYRVVSEELAVAAVAVFAVALVCGRGGAGAALGAAVLVLHFVPVARCLLAQRRTVHQLVPFTRLVPKHHKHTRPSRLVTSSS